MEEERRGRPDLPLPRVGALDLGSSRPGRRGKTELDVGCWLNLTLFHTQTQLKNYGGICASVIKEDPARHRCWESETTGRLSTETLDFRELESGNMGELRDKQGGYSRDSNAQRGRGRGRVWCSQTLQPGHQWKLGALRACLSQLERKGEKVLPALSHAQVSHGCELGSVEDTTWRRLSPQDRAEEGEDEQRVSGQTDPGPTQHVERQGKEKGRLHFGPAPSLSSSNWSANWFPAMQPQEMALMVLGPKVMSVGFIS